MQERNYKKMTGEEELTGNWKDHIHLHFVVLLFGFTAILGKLISVDATTLVSYRMLFAAMGIGLFVFLTKRYKVLPLKTIFQLLGVGIIVALHWIFFFGAVKVSNVSVTLGCMASTTLFTAFLEPLFDKTKIHWVEILIGLVIILGLYIITQFAFHYYLGIIYAIISAFLASLFGVINRKLVLKLHTPALMSMYEMLSGFVLITLYLSYHDKLTLPHQLIFADWIYLLILAWVCTAYAFVATVFISKKLKAYSVSLAINMEPVYGIVLAYFIFGESEKMNGGFYLGAIILISAIFVYPYLKKRFR